MAEQKLRHIDPGLVEKMSAMLTKQSPAEIQRLFGIGINTWTKIRRGEAIRESVARRLLARLRDDLGIEA